MPDLGLTHVAFVVGDLEASLAFYEKYARMMPIHERKDGPVNARVAWITDGTRPFVLVLIEIPSLVPGRKRLARFLRRFLPSFSHLGVACESREEVDRLCELGAEEGVLASKPRDLGAPVGYFGMLSDPDGNSLEVAFGQEVGLTFEQSRG